MFGHVPFENSFPFNAQFISSPAERLLKNGTSINLSTSSIFSKYPSVYACGID